MDRGFMWVGPIAQKQTFQAAVADRKLLLPHLVGRTEVARPALLLLLEVPLSRPGGSAASLPQGPQAPSESPGSVPALLTSSPGMRPADQLTGRRTVGRALLMQSPRPGWRSGWRSQGGGQQGLGTSGGQERAAVWASHVQGLCVSAASLPAPLRSKATQ